MLRPLELKFEASCTVEVEPTAWTDSKFLVSCMKTLPLSLVLVDLIYILR